MKEANGKSSKTAAHSKEFVPSVANFMISQKNYVYGEKTNTLNNSNSLTHFDGKMVLADLARQRRILPSVYFSNSSRKRVISLALSAGREKPCCWDRRKCISTFPKKCIQFSKL